MNAGGVIVQANRRFHRLFGYEYGSLKGVSIEALVPPAGRERHRRLREGYQEDPSDRLMSERRDLAGLTKQGEAIAVEVSLAAALIEGEPMTIAWVIDQTERHQLDERFRRAIEGAPSGIVFVDEAGVIVLCNRQACEDFGYTRAELEGQLVDILLPKELVAAHPAHRSRFLADPHQRPMGHGRDLRARRKDGSEFPVEIGLTPIPSSGGLWTMASIVDISLRKQAEDSLQMRNEELLDFVYSASHDLKAPLSTIRGLIAIALDDLEEGKAEAVADLLVQVDRKAERLSKLVEGTLALAGASRADSNADEVDLAELAADIIADLTFFAEHRGVRLSIDVPADLRMSTSVQRLRLIFENLLLNSIKYHDPDKMDCLASVKAVRQDDRIVLEFADNGLGIPAGAHSKVFQMFQRFHPDRAEGNGLGLAMVKKQVSALGGVITFESSPAGTTFRVVLPKEAHR